MTTLICLGILAWFCLGVFAASLAVMLAVVPLLLAGAFVFWFVNAPVEGAEMVPRPITFSPALNPSPSGAQPYSLSRGAARIPFSERGRAGYYELNIDALWDGEGNHGKTIGMATMRSIRLWHIVNLFGTSHPDCSKVLRDDRAIQFDIPDEAFFARRPVTTEEKAALLAEYCELPRH